MMQEFAKHAAVLSSILLASTGAFASDSQNVSADRPQGDEADVQHQFSLMLSPVHLSMPVVEVTGEYRVDDNIGVAVLLGGGTYTSTHFNGSSIVDDQYSVLEGGAQLRYYVVGNFVHGMQVGAEALYIHIDSDENDFVSGSAEGLAVGPFVGYKIATNIGFTFDAQLGAQYVGLRGEASGGGVTVEDSESSVIALLNLNVGWSF